MAKVHWLGAGLSTPPGIRRLVELGFDLWLWNRSVAKAQDILQGVQGQSQAKSMDWQDLAANVSAGDVVVSMLPGTFHVQAAELAIANGAHFVSSSYISPEMQSLHEASIAANVCLVNEVGLDPGIDHLMAHCLIDSYRKSAAYAVSNEVEFKSYCGGLPAQMNDFTYKFSWSPLGVLKALKSPAQWREFAATQNSAKPWLSVRSYGARLTDGSSEIFEAYPNRDSLPFMQQYNFDPEWPVKTFVRGTLRGKGWTHAWQDIFGLVDSLEGAPADEVEAKLGAVSDDLWRQHAYDEGEADRVVLCVELSACNPDNGEIIWHQSYNMDAYGNEQGSAMARLVSLTVSLAVEAVLAGNICAGVTAAPKEELAESWLSFMRQRGEPIQLTDYLAE